MIPCYCHCVISLTSRIGAYRLCISYCRSYVFVDVTIYNSDRQQMLNYLWTYACSSLELIWEKLVLLVTLYNEKLFKIVGWS